MTQIALPLAWPDEGGEGGFLVTASNAQAARTLEHWAGWPVMAALLIGPPRSGRSTLARVFAARSGGTVIDDAQRQDEAAIFHAWNRAQAERRPLVVVADAAPPAWAVALPDLRTRLAAGPLATIGPPDDALVSALLEQGFARARVDARPDLIAWLSARAERSHVSVMHVIDTLVAAALGGHRRLSIPMARETLGASATFIPDTPPS
ncbi:chromosomal replication initiator DnaA [Sphingomonas sp. Leaf412]|uniref:DnaA ATPase domain-containing protein n=1 Tax=Sphingomonas sp. Leaf412 TaxID=1736370 RepID=UPI0006FE9CE3|nr:DnaA/Hda family protein [Sphingomonas sp. Leaf412]KQT32454.1 chromosomal replication initiator DnaA [Sphingomonas sp. Leaf412]